MHYCSDTRDSPNLRTLIGAHGQETQIVICGEKVTQPSSIERTPKTKVGRRTYTNCISSNDMQGMVRLIIKGIA